MRKPTRIELALVVMGLVMFGLWRMSVRSGAAISADIVLVKAERVEAERRATDAHRATQSLQREKITGDLIAGDSIAKLTAANEVAEARANEVAAEGRATFVAILNSLADSLPDMADVTLLVESRELQHQIEVLSLRDMVGRERSASDILRGQLGRSNDLVGGLQRELTLSHEDIQLANVQLGLLESMHGKGFSNLELASLSTAAFFVSTKVLNAPTIEGLVVGATTWVVLDGDSKLLRWIL